MSTNRDRATDRRPRWPRWVYDEGSEPDYRFSFANERTFLAWIRTALALIAAGVALDVLDVSMPAMVGEGLSVVLLVLGIAAAVAAFLRWAAAERAMRRREPLPGSRLSLVVTVLVAATGVVLLLLAR